MIKNCVVSGQAAVCVKKCPKATNYEAFICYYDVQDEVDADPTHETGWEYVANFKCMYEIATKDGKHINTGAFSI